MPLNRPTPSSPCARSPRPVAPPAIDHLESRVLLAASLGADGTLQVTGTNGPDQITLRRAASDPTLLHVQEGTTSLFVFLLDRVNAVSVDLGGGDDALNLDTTPGIVTRAAGDMPVTVRGGAGADSLLVFGAPAGPLHQVFTVGPDAGSGTHVSRIGAGDAAGFAQSVSFTGIESAVDTSVAASLTIVGTGAANVVELTSGPLAGNITPTGTVRFFDVTPLPPGTAVPQSAAAAPAHSGTTTPAAAALDARDPESRREAKRAAKEAKVEAKRLAKETKRLARERKRAEMLARKNKLAVAPPAAAPATPARDVLAIDRTHTVLHFANKTAVTIDTQAGDDRIDVNFAGAVPASLQTLTLDGGAGADRVTTPSLPPSVAVETANVESTSAVRDFVLTTDRGPTGQPPTPPPPAPETPIPNEPPAPVASAATSSRGRDDKDSSNASSTRNASSSRDADSSSSKDKDEKENKDKSQDSNASNDD